MKRTYIYGAVILPLVCLMHTACQEEHSSEDVAQAKLNNEALSNKLIALQNDAAQAPKENYDELMAEKNTLQTKITEVDEKLTQVDNAKAELILKKAELNKEIEMEKAYTQQLESAFNQAKK